jgi:hypothetical protein
MLHRTGFSAKDIFSRFSDYRPAKEDLILCVRHKSTSFNWQFNEPDYDFHISTPWPRFGAGRPAATGVLF